MAKNKNEYPVPQFRNLEEEDKYWQSHSPLMEGYEGKAQKKKQNRESFLSVRLTGEELSRLKEQAAFHGVGSSTYARQAIIQAIESGIGSVSPTLLLSLFKRLHSTTGQPQEEHLKQVDKLYRQYIEAEEAFARNFARFIMPGMTTPQEDKAPMDSVTEA